MEFITAAQRMLMKVPPTYIVGIIHSELTYCKTKLLSELDPRSYPYESEPHNAYMVCRYSHGGIDQTREVLSELFSRLVSYVAEYHGKTIDEVIEDMNDLYIRKNHDYGNSWEEEIHELGILPLYIRLREKINRCLSIIDNGQWVQDENQVSTLEDICNYCIITYMVL